MGKFNWQNGTLVTPARVEISGEVYDVTPEQYSGQTPLSAENLNAMQDGIYSDMGNKENLATTNKDSLVSAINETVVESTTNANGTAIKYSNGIMICSNTQTFTNVKITSQWGSCYASSNDARLFNDYPVPFVNEPQCIFTIKTTSGDCWLCSKGTSAQQTNRPPNWQVVRPNSSTIDSLTISYIAIGKWK